MRQSINPEYSVGTGDYIEYYSRVKELAKDKNWDQDMINKMLSNRELFEKKYAMVS